MSELVEEILSRLHLVPRYRQRLAFVPFEQGRPVWVDDPHFNITYHVRHTALPRPGGDEELKRLAGRVFSQALDRARPLWELWLVEGLSRRPLRAADEDPPRARRRRLRRRHRDRAVRRLARPDAGRAARAGMESASASDLDPAARGRAARAGDRARRDRARRPARRCAVRAPSRTASAARSPASVR